MQSLVVPEVATSRMHTSLSRGRGSGTVLIWSTSGGPYAVHTAALIWSPSRQLKSGHEFADVDLYQSAPGRNRTCCLSIRILKLCPESYRRASGSVYTT